MRIRNTSVLRHIKGEERFTEVRTMEEKKEWKPEEPEVQEDKAQDSKLQDEDLDGVAGGTRGPLTVGNGRPIK